MNLNSIKNLISSKINLIIFLIINIIIIILISNFINTNVLKTISYDPSKDSSAIKAPKKVNIKQFNEVIQNIESKKNNPHIDSANNIFSDNKTINKQAPSRYDAPINNQPDFSL